MRVRVEQDNIGALILTPQNDRLRGRIRRHLKSFGVQSDGTAYIQSDYDVEHFINEYVPARKRAPIRNGWGTTIDIDPWVLGHIYGYDTQEVL